MTGPTIAITVRQPSMPGIRATAITRSVGPPGLVTRQRATSAVRRTSTKAEPAPARSVRTPAAPTRARRHAKRREALLSATSRGDCPARDRCTTAADLAPISVSWVWVSRRIAASRRESGLSRIVSFRRTVYFRENRGPPPERPTACPDESGTSGDACARGAGRVVALFAAEGYRGDCLAAARRRWPAGAVPRSLEQSTKLVSERGHRESYVGGRAERVSQAASGRPLLRTLAAIYRDT